MTKSVRFIILVLFSIVFANGYSQNEKREISEIARQAVPDPNSLIDDKYIVSREIDPAQGKEIVGIIVPGHPPENYRAPIATPDKSAVTLSNVPAFTWVFGCSATSAAMIAGYYDNTGYPNMYTGPTNGGVMPMNNSSWGTEIINGENRAHCPLSATSEGIDGRATRGHVEDYWVQVDHAGPDPFITNGWTEHTQGDCTSDFMGTNQSNWNNSDGGTLFFYYPSGSPLYDYTGSEVSDNQKDGCHGFRQFIESRGYTVISNYDQLIYGYGGNTLGFTYDQYKAEIDAGRPVIIQVEGHSMVGYGYDNASSTIYIHNTWDYSSHTMTWGGYYEGMLHYAVAVFELEACDPPDAPTLVSPADGATDQSTSLILSWNDPGSTDSFNLQVDDDFDFSSPYYDQSDLTSTSQSVTGLNTSTLYYWRVNAENGGGTSSWSATWSFTTAAVATDPDIDIRPDTLTFGNEEAVSSKCDTISNTGDALLTIYSINSNKDWLTIDESVPFSIAAGDEQEMCVTVDWYTVSGLSDTATITILSDDPDESSYEVYVIANKNLLPPDAPTLSGPSHETTCHPTSITFSWNDPGNADSYYLQVDDDMDFSSPFHDNSTIITTSHSVPGLASGTTYHWRVSATNTAGTSDWSSIWHFTTIAEMSSTPALSSPPSGSVNQSDPVLLIWNITSGADSYRIQIDDNGDFNNPVVDEDELNNNSFEFSGLNDGTTYYWRIKAFNDCDAESVWSEIWSFTGTPTYLSDITDNEYMLSQNYPNPFDHSTSIDFIIPASANVIFEVLDIDGRVISTYENYYEAGQNTFTLDFNDPLRKGVYFYRMKAADFVQTKVLIIE